MRVMNHGTTPLNGWAVAWQPGAGTRLSSVWNGVLSSSAGGRIKVANADDNRVIPRGSSVTFGFTATSTGDNVPAGSIGCVAS